MLFAGYLNRDYGFHARTGAAPLMDNVLYQAYRVTTTLINGQLCITNFVLTLLVVVSIAIVSPAVAMVGIAAVAVSYLVFYQRSGAVSPAMDVCRPSSARPSWRWSSSRSSESNI